MKMPSWLIRLRDVVWTAVFSVVFIIVAIALAVALPGSSLPIVFGLASVSCALLAQRV